MKPTWMKNKTSTGIPNAGRRAFLARGVVGGAGSLLLGTLGCGPVPESEREGAGLTPECDETETNPLGPYYREGAPVRSDLAAGQPGTILLLEGSVLGGADCETALEGALLDVWQADDAGAYDNDSPDFLFRGRLYTGADGRYSLRTILPGRYELAPGQFRPRHIHLKLEAAGHRAIVTQLYFSGDPYNESDSMFRESLVVDSAEGGEGLVGSFTFVLGALAEVASS